MTYEEALAYISDLSHRGWRLGLDRMEEFIRRAGLEEAIGPSLDPDRPARTSGLSGAHSSPKFIHVAGTNGKGSVTAYLQYILREAGFKVGGFFSPYVYDIRERIQLDCEMISMEDFVRLVEWLKPIAETFDGSEFGGITEFEFKTAMGFAYWQEKGCDWVALEVGLGGRLDATNVVTPACSVITSIGLDHTDILGKTHEEIAREKAGIFKPGVPVVVGNVVQDVLQVLEDKAAALGCPTWWLGEHFGIDPCAVWLPDRKVTDVRPPLPGRHQWGNLAVALAALEASELRLDEATIRSGLQKVRLPGRFERRSAMGKEIILDGAHNLESIRQLRLTLANEMPGRRFNLLFGMLQGHDAEPVCRTLEPLSSEIHIAPIDFRRTLQPAELSMNFQSATQLHGSAEEALHAALLSPNRDPILVTGSFYLVGEVGRALSTSAQ